MVSWVIELNEKIKYILLGLIGSLIGNGIVFFLLAFSSSKYGTLADWVSGIGTVAAIFFVYLQINEQRSEFKESKKHYLQIAIWTQSHAEKSTNGGIIVGGHDFRTWAVNDGLTAASFKFLGFCRKDKFKDIYEDDSVLLDPYTFTKKHLLPSSSPDFELLQPGEISEQHIFPVDKILQELGNPQYLYVMYMDALGEIFKREIIVAKND